MKTKLNPVDQESFNIWRNEFTAINGHEPEVTDAWQAVNSSVQPGLARCPSCDAEPVFAFDKNFGQWSGECKRCGVVGPSADTKTDAIKKWMAWHDQTNFAQATGCARMLTADEILLALAPGPDGKYVVYAHEVLQRKFCQVNNITLTE